MSTDLEKLENSLVSIASETYRVEKVFERVMKSLPPEEQSKYMSQFSWFSKKVSRALNEAGLRVVNLEGSIYDPGMAIAPLNLDDFEIEDTLVVEQMIEPIIMQEDAVRKIGTAVLGRIEK